jgi:hypothetical protein
MWSQDKIHKSYGVYGPMICSKCTYCFGGTNSERESGMGGKCVDSTVFQYNMSALARRNSFTRSTNSRCLTNGRAGCINI